MDRGWEWLVTLMLVLGGEDVGRATIAGPFDPGLFVISFPPLVLRMSLLMGSWVMSSIQHLRDLKTFFGTTFKIKALAEATAPSVEDFVNQDEGDDTVMGMETSKGAAIPEAFILSCVGTGFTNTAKKTLVLLSLALLFCLRTNVLRSRSG